VSSPRNDSHPRPGARVAAQCGRVRGLVTGAVRRLRLQLAAGSEESRCPGTLRPLFLPGRWLGWMITKLKPAGLRTGGTRYPAPCQIWNPSGLLA